ncbi:MAG: M15 family metallopeptidase [Clostridia bacterium]|nr:M15 family metallopeptidase [Clostridia bacterium]
MVMHAVQKQIFIVRLVLGLALLMLFSGCNSVPGASEPMVTPAPTTAPTASPTPPPAPLLSFSGDFPQEGAILPLGADHGLSGRISSNYPLISVTLSDTCAYHSDPFYPYSVTLELSPEDQFLSVDLQKSPKVFQPSLDQVFDFSRLTPGVHTLTLSARCAGCEEVHTLEKRSFYILGTEWKKILPEDFNGSFGDAMEFFDDVDRFLYRYQHVDGRYIVADPEWEKTHITSLPGFGGRDWLVHVDAVPYYERAFAYLRAVHVRIHGTNGDTGVLPLSDLIDTYNGSYVSRFTSSLKTISHHAFGTASDVNARMAPNLNNKENKKIISQAVKNDLAYTGILQEDGLSYYDFTYSGDAALTEDGVPEPVVNYLLYELAFYRAGFEWGHYYVSTSDGMHFTLTDRVRLSHDGKSGLRKVFSYIPEEETLGAPSG